MRSRHRKVRIVGTSLLACLVLAFAGTAPASGAETEAGPFVRIPFTIAPKPALTVRSTALHLLVEQRGCGPIYDHARLAWSSRRLTVKLLAKPARGAPERGIACPDYIAIVPITVPLGRPLGARRVFDGYEDPPRPAKVGEAPLE